GDARPVQRGGRCWIPRRYPPHERGAHEGVQAARRHRRFRDRVPPSVLRGVLPRCREERRVEVGLGSVLTSPAPMAQTAQQEKSDSGGALERGEIVRFSRAPIALPSADDQEFLRTALAPFLARKNVSLYPEADRLTGLQAPRGIKERARRILAGHSARVRAFLARAMPAFTRGMRVGTSSFRHLEEEGGDL